MGGSGASGELPRSRTEKYVLRIAGKPDAEIEVSRGSYLWGLQCQVAELITKERKEQHPDAMDVDPHTVSILIDGKGIEGNPLLSEIVQPGHVIEVQVVQ
jgi:hypothetical protein